MCFKPKYNVLLTALACNAPAGFLIAELGPEVHQMRDKDIVKGLRIFQRRKHRHLSGPVLDERLIGNIDTDPRRRRWREAWAGGVTIGRVRGGGDSDGGRRLGWRRRPAPRRRRLAIRAGSGRRWRQVDGGGKGRGRARYRREFRASFRRRLAGRAARGLAR